MTTDLPPTFFLYIRSRHSAADEFSGFILCDAASTAENGQAIWKITPRAPVYSVMSTVQSVKGEHFGEKYRGQCTVRSHDGLLLAKRFNNTTNWSSHTQLTVCGADGIIYPVLEISKHTTVFGSYQLKRNVPLKWLTTTGVPAPAPAPAVVAVTPSDNVIQHVAPASKKPKVNRAATSAGTLSLFVAKQLLEFAQMKHEMCPITAEEFIMGETAVMPCGHLFMRMAIEETFKKEPGKCPACRQLGAPTYC